MVGRLNMVGLPSPLDTLRGEVVYVLLAESNIRDYLPYLLTVISDLKNICPLFKDNAEPGSKSKL